MSDDLSAILQSIAATQASLIKRIEDLEKRGVESKGQADWGNRAMQEGLCRPTDPPSLSIAYERGTVWIYWHKTSPGGYASIMPGGWQKNLNYAVGESVTAFTNAYYYRWGIVGLCWNAYWAPWLFENATEFEKPDQAINDFWAKMMPYGYGVSLYTKLPGYSNYLLLPLCAVLFRNNGTIVGTGKVYPITLNDRNQSSFITRDLRPQLTFFW